MTSIFELTGLELASAIAARKISPVEAVQAALSRIESFSRINAFQTVAADQALDLAREAERKVMQGGPLPPLHGVPLSVKDLIDTAGIKTTMGSYVFEHNVPSQDGVSVARAKAAGAIVIGKTTSPEFGHGQHPVAPIFGRTLNPINPDVTPGASSCGAAAAIAAGMGQLALGSDGGGSIRIPAACCGIVGLKATLGAIPHLQLPDMFGANSFIGPMTRTVADAELLFRAIAGPDRADPYGQAEPRPTKTFDSFSKLRVAWIPDGGARLDPETAQAIAAAIEIMRAHGAVVEEIALDLKAYENTFNTILRIGLAARVGRFVPEFRHRMSATLLEEIERGERFSAVEMAHVAYERTKLFREIQGILARSDVIVSPTTTAPALPIDMDLTGDIEIAGRNGGTVRGAWYPFTYPFNLTGHPALSMPCGYSAAGLPIGLQIVAAWHEDLFLLQLAKRLESALAMPSVLTRLAA
jgi:aspartyl-tRNA(Asn)/glutamyl-tRNA(Gln) amidotransferase subunit A